METNKGLLQRVQELEAQVKDPIVEKKAKVKRVSRNKAKKGWVVVGVINNGHINFVKRQVQNATFDLDGGDTYHATDGHEAVMYKGSPLIIQHKGKLNPVDLSMSGNNETYGHKYVMARMAGDAIKLKKTASGMIWVIGIIILVAIVGKVLNWY